jgi:hypothetical protein
VPTGAPATLLLTDPLVRQELAMSPLLLLDLARTIDADHRREAQQQSQAATAAPTAKGGRR